ncbi:type II secretion system F family protein [Microbacterium sp. NPDC055910]|uniref:type II secretion system F family protein n=1 Tax=Microbacterium sp. NPDC055910 TaxID=3345659 RepID=UPI0035DEF32C
MKGADAAAVADTVLRLAVLLQAGVAPARAWGHLAEAGDPHALSVHRALEHAASPAAAIAAAGETPPEPRRRFARRHPSASGAARAWRDVAAAWTIATTVGAPLAETLRGLAVALRDAQEAADDVRVALAEPTGTAKLMAWLPLVAVVLGVALGFDTVATLATNPFGIGCLVAGVVLMVIAHRWSGALVRAAGGADGIPGLDADLLAIALSGGVSIERGRRLVERASGEPTAATTEGILALSASAGVPAVELLRASAALARHRARVEGRLRSARLSMRLLLPLGVCTLPAFLLLGVAPMLLSVGSALPLSL